MTRPDRRHRRRAQTVYDPEIPADIYELGLIYRIDIAEDRAVTVDMTLTTPNCPARRNCPVMVENAVAQRLRRPRLKVNIVWDPPWDQTRMSDEARARSHVVSSGPQRCCCALFPCGEGGSEFNVTDWVRVDCNPSPKCGLLNVRCCPLRKGRGHKKQALRLPW